MNSLVNKIKSLRKTEVGRTISARMREFESFRNKQTEQWFSELCFCILAANSKAKTSIAIQQQLGANGFLNSNKENIVATIKANKHRFHNKKAQYVVEARRHLDVKHHVQHVIKGNSCNGECNSNKKTSECNKEFHAREWLVSNIKGIGYKEASHFLRNVGCSNIAILDRHVINVMIEHNLLKQKPKTVTRKNYFGIENKLKSVAGKLSMSLGELDLYMWYMKTGEVLK